MKIDGKQIAQELLSDIQLRIDQLSFTPLLCDVMVGDDPVSLSYVRIKQRVAEKHGLLFELIQLPENASEAEIVAQIKLIQQRPELCGLIVQLPLPIHIDGNAILSSIDPGVDVDILSPASSNLFYNNNGLLVPPTAGAIVYILDSLPIEHAALKYAVLGQGELVGKPTAHLLEQRGYAVSRIDSTTLNSDELLAAADVIVCGVGKAGVLRGDQVKDGVVIIDAGTSESGGSITGDADFNSIAPKAAYITPVPGGVGPVTVAKLLENVVKVAETRLTH